MIIVMLIMIAFCIIGIVLTMCDVKDGACGMFCIILIMCFLTAVCEREETKTDQTELNMLRQVLVDNGLATYTPMVVEKKFELIQKVVAEKGD